MAETKLKPQSLDTEVNFGWQLVSESWAYASATTITVPTDATTRFQKGDRLRLKQGAGYKYYYIVGVAATTLTVTGGTDYTVANSAITDIYISRAVSPMGFPFTFNWTWTISGSTGSLGSYSDTANYAKFFIVGNICHVMAEKYVSNISSWTGNFSGTLPVTVLPGCNVMIGFARGPFDAALKTFETAAGTANHTAKTQAAGSILSYADALTNAAGLDLNGSYLI